MGRGVAHSVLILSLVITIGIALGKVKVAGVSLGITWILFVGIIFGHFNMNLDEHLLHFLKEFGLILFVYSIGLQVGPGFFSAFKKGGLTLNMVAMTVVFSGVILAIVLHFVSGVPITTMVGILSGAVTNTPGLGAAQQANVIGKRLRDIHPLVKRYFVVSHIYRAETGKVEMANADTVLRLNDKVLLTSAPVDIDAITVFFGCQAEMNWENEETDLVASPNLQLQIGDRVMIVGNEFAVVCHCLSAYDVPACAHGTVDDSVACINIGY